MSQKNKDERLAIRLFKGILDDLDLKDASDMKIFITSWEKTYAEALQYTKDWMIS